MGKTDRNTVKIAARDRGKHRGQVFILDKRCFSVAKRWAGSRPGEMRCAVVNELHRAGKNHKDKLAADGRR